MLLNVPPTCDIPGILFANGVNKNCRINLLGKKAVWGQLLTVPLLNYMPEQS